MKNGGSHRIFWMLIFFVSCACIHALEAVDEVLVMGGTMVFGNGEKIEKYAHDVDTVYVSKYEFTWEMFASVVNYGIEKRYVKIEKNKLYPLTGVFPQYFEMMSDLSKNSKHISVTDGKIAVKSGAEKWPANNISWFGAALLCNILSEMNGYTPCYNAKTWEIIDGADGYRLPTFEEWEYSARGGAESRGYVFSGSNEAAEVGWFRSNSGGETHPVGMLKPNELGLYDMNGNVHEFCTEKNKYLNVLAGVRLVAANLIWRGGSYSSAEVDSYHFQQNMNYPDFVCPFMDVGFRTVRKSF